MRTVKDAQRNIDFVNRRLFERGQSFYYCINSHNGYRQLDMYTKCADCTKAMADGINRVCRHDTFYECVGYYTTGELAETTNGMKHLAFMAI